MARISEKYLAGFLDADGSFGIKFRRLTNGRFKPFIWLDASQKNSRSKVIYLFARDYGGSVTFVPVAHPKRDDQVKWNLSSKEARTLLARITKYFVLRRTFAEWCLSAEKQGPLTRIEMEAMRAEAKVRRLMRSDPLPNYPSRKWTAGYVDGNGCFASRLNKASAHCTPAVLSMRITDGSTDIEGLQLLQKAFGGKIHHEATRATWVLHLEPSKALRFIPFFAKHLIVKKAEAYFMLACAEGGNYRDGVPIHQALQHLKTQEQRLSDPEVDISFLLRRVRFDVPDRRGWHMKRNAI